MVKLASIDLGSNSTRLLIAEVNDQGLNVLTRMHIVTKMSEKIEQTETREATSERNEVITKVLVVSRLYEVICIQCVYR